jgi:chromate transporter
MDLADSRMNFLLLYLLLAKATLTSFSGTSSLPVIRHDFVEHYHTLTDRQLNTAIATGQAAPGPNGLYVVSIGYFVAGVPGGCAGLLAVITPAFLIIPMLQFLGRWADRPRIQSALRAVTIAAAGLVLTTTLPLARDALTGPIPLAIALASFVFLLFKQQSTVLVIVAAALAGYVGQLLS